MEVEHRDYISTSTRLSPNTLAHPADSVYTTKELGAIYSPDKTFFRVWAPTARSVVVNLYDAPTFGKPRSFLMVRDIDGTWEFEQSGDMLGAWYTYSALGDDPRFNPRNELLDPYAGCVTGYNGRSIVTHDTTPVADAPPLFVADSIIYEMHIRDFTIDPDSGIQRRGKYLGLTEAGTNLTDRVDIATGLDHLVELGVNTVQLMPLSEFHGNESEDKYGWGYDAVHHNSPDGWYATERFDARRVTEVKRMIDALHKLNIRVTLDVVFTHTFEDVHRGMIYSFEGLVPGYYYRLKHDGSYWDGSGTGNEFRTEAPMARRYIIDSLKRWVTEYKIDGFRFDLLGLLDRDTLRDIVSELRAINPNLLIYGEPWTGGATPIEPSYKGVQRSQGWSVFNDNFRDALKGQVFNAREKGFVQNGSSVSAIKTGICGAIDDFTDSPIEAVNYIECHDNHTLWDRLMISTIDNAEITDSDRRAMDKLAAVILFTSFGIPFIQSGQEFLRSKGGDHNSYDKPDAVNMIRWKQKSENLDVFEYYRGLIALRSSHKIFRLKTANDVRKSIKFLDDIGMSVPDGCIAYMLDDISVPDDIDEWSRALVILNANANDIDINIPEGKWQVFVDSKDANIVPIKNNSHNIGSGTARVRKRSALVLGEIRK